MYLFKGVPLPPKTYNSPQNGWQIVCSESFFGRDSELQIYQGNFLLTDNKHRKLFVTKESKWCKFMPKMHQHTFGGRAPLEELIRSPDPVTATEAYFNRGTEGR